MLYKKSLRPDDLFLFIFPLCTLLIVAISAFTYLYTKSFLSSGLYSLTCMAATLAYLIFCGAFVYMRVAPPPDIVTHHGLGVWLNGTKVSAEAMDSAVDFYINKVVVIDERLTKAKLFVELSKIRLDWTKNRPYLIPVGWDVTDGFGALRHRTARIRWKGTVANSELFHVFHHVVAEILYGDKDARHTRKSFWDQCLLITAWYRLLEKKDYAA